ncbi:unnamed protein product [Moneuplotes crassus]|uniref:Uncharacterized protein n=1 Tax=Euplotes crassus TaxID=5936 RepID=A0AAD1UD85_EUPCR|nr:unnamed protein product [Moneuplotes crassus]
MHQLPLNITLSDSTFNNITSGLISIEGSKQTEDLSTLFIMSNCSFTNIKSSVNTFMEVQQKTEVVIERSSFTNLTLTTFISGVMNIFDGAKVTVLHSILTKNSATVASIAKIEANALMTIDNCSISENFAITNGVFEISSFGMAVIKNSQIFKNYAIQYPVGTVFLSTESSNITNTEIYSNKLISKSSVTTETSEDCVNLCFLHQEMKAYLNSTNLTATSEQGYLFQVLQGNLNILNSTHIHDENLVLKSFLSTVTVENSQFSNVEYSISPLNILDSIFTMEHTQISGAQASSVEESFIIANSAKMSVNNVTYSDSNSQIMISLSSHLEMNQIKIQNVSECPYLLSVVLCDWFYLANIEVQYSTPSEAVMVYVHDTANITLESINVSNTTSTFAFFKNSEITKITGLKMTSLNQTLTFVNSNVKELSHSEFKDNFSNSSGGAISMTNSKLAIESTNFTRNSATEGGAIIFECTSFASCELNITKSIFEKNSATVKGGAISYNYNYPNIIETTFINNSAVYGPNYASYPARIGERNSTINDPIEIDNVASGIIITENLELALIDLDDQVMVLDDENQILILPSDSSKSSVSGTNTAQVKQGVAVFDNLALEVSKELRKSNFSVSSKSINSAKVKEVLGSSFQQKELEASFRDCQPGERILGDKCEVCAAGTYSLSYNSTECAKCDFDAECLGGSEIYLRSGHWRRFHNSTKVVECINKDSCKGEYKPDGSSPAVCAEGYTGNLCAQCVVNDEVKYERVNDYECRKCPNAVWNGFQVIGVILLVLAFYIFLVIINVRKTSESELSVMLRILANYLQLITVSTSITNNFPSSILAISYPARIFGGSANVFLSFDCFIKDTEIKLFFDSNAIFKLFLLCFLPIILFCIIAVMWVFIYFVKRQWVPNPKRNLIISFITVVFLLHPKLTENSINLLRCSELDEDNKVVRIDTNIECFSSQHIKWIIFVSGPIILIWVIACPILALIIIYSGKKNSKNSNLSKYFIMIYQGLKPNRKYWEFINTLRKIVVLFSLLLSTTMAVGISMLALVFTARLQIYLDPYKNPQHSKVEYLAIMAGILTISGGLLFSQDEQHKILNSYILVAIVIINFKFILEWLYFVVSIYKKNQIAMFILKISSKLLCKKEKILSDNAKEFENANNSLNLQKNRLSSIDAQQYQTPMHKKLLPKPIKMKRKGVILKKKKRIKKCKKGRFRRMKREEEEKEQEHHNTTENQNSLRTDQRYSGRSPRSGRRNAVSFYPATEAKQNKLSEFKFL